MDADLTKRIVKAVASVRQDLKDLLLPSTEAAAPPDQPVIPHSIVVGTRGYIEKIVFEINSSYLATAYDGAAVLIRRLVEVLIIEVFEAKGIGHKIKGTDGNYFFLSDLIPLMLTETSWSLSRTVKSALPKLKDIGDLSAHSRMYNAKRVYIDEAKDRVRIVTEELLYLSGLKK